MRRSLPIAGLVLLSLAVGACTSGATTAPSVAAPSVAPSTAASVPASVAPSATPDACAAANLKLTTAGKLTIGTDNPAYPPYYDIPAAATKPWELGDPTDGKGFESAFAYALADKLGFAKADVTWIVVPFDNSFAKPSLSARA